MHILIFALIFRKITYRRTELFLVREMLQLIELLNGTSVLKEMAFHTMV